MKGLGKRYVKLKYSWWWCILTWRLPDSGEDSLTASACSWWRDSWPEGIGEDCVRLEGGISFWLGRRCQLTRKAKTMDSTIGILHWLSKPRAPIWWYVQVLDFFIVFFHAMNWTSWTVSAKILSFFFVQLGGLFGTLLGHYRHYWVHQRWHFGIGNWGLGGSQDLFLGWEFSTAWDKVILP